jgi:hypothetical protein
MVTRKRTTTETADEPTTTRTSTITGAEILAALEDDPDYLADSSIVSVQEIGPKEVLVTVQGNGNNGDQTFRCRPDTDLNAVLEQLENPLPVNKP